MRLTLLCNISIKYPLTYPCPTQYYAFYIIIIYEYLNRINISIQTVLHLIQVEPKTVPDRKGSQGIHPMAFPVQLQSANREQYRLPAREEARHKEKGKCINRKLNNGKREANKKAATDKQQLINNKQSTKSYATNSTQSWDATNMGE